MVNPSRSAMRVLGQCGGLAAGLCGLVLLAAAPSLAAKTPGVALDRVSFAMRGPLKTGASQRLLFKVHAPAGQRVTAVFVHLTMPAMPMHEHTLRAKALGHGRYAVRAALTMPGRWLAHVTVASGGASVTRVLPFHTIYGHPTPWRTLGIGFGLFVLVTGLLTYRLRRRPTPIAAAERHDA